MKELNDIEIESINGAGWGFLLALADAAIDFTKGFVDGVKAGLGTEETK